MPTRWRTGLLGYGGALAAVTLVSLFIGLVLGQVSLANSSMLYLLAVLASAVAFGRGPAIFASLGAFVIFDWFFVNPRHALTVTDPGEWVSLLFFLLTATVTGQLAAGQRARAREAQQREREAVVLYDVVRLLGEGSSREVLQAVAERLLQELQVRGVGIELSDPDDARAVKADADADDGTTWVSAGDPEVLAGLRRTRPTARVMQQGALPSALPSAHDHATPGRWVRVVRPTRTTASRAAGSVTPDADVHLVPVRVGDRRVGALLLVGTSERFDASDDRLVSAAAAQIGGAHERARLRKEATEAEILRRTDELRAALLNAVSHDLRTPLATIMASAGSLQQRDVAWTDQERLDFAQAIEEEAARLNHLVGNLLDLSRIEGGSLQPQQSWQLLETVVEDVVERLKPVLRQHDLRVEVEPDLPPMWFDPVEIGEVLYNLVENAAKYAPSDTEIGITVHKDGNEVSVAVEDRGPGFPPAAAPHLFDPFYRVADAGSHAGPRGLGLGLAIVKGLVQAHAGRVWAENRAGGGARFTFTLPLAEVPADVARVGNGTL